MRGKCKKCGVNEVVEPDNSEHYGDYDKPLCLYCGKYQVDNGTELLGDRFSI